MPEIETIEEFIEDLPDYQPVVKSRNSPSRQAITGSISEPLLELEEIPEPQPEEIESGHDPRLRTLYMMEHGCELRKESERLVIEKDDEILAEIPAIKVDQVLVFGNSKITTPAMNYCLSENIPIVLLSSQGRYNGVIDTHSTASVLLHREQFKRAEDDAFCLQQAKAMVTGKLANSRLILSRQARKRNNEKIQNALEAIKQSMEKVPALTTLDELRGHEGHSAKVYFAAMSELLGETWAFKGRKRQPPPDPVNALLSFGYTLLFYNVFSLMKARGLNPHVGFLHPIRQGHPALVSDMMEEFRPIVVDTVVLSLLLNQQLTLEQFTISTEQGSCYLNNEARKIFIKSFEKKMNSALTHPVSGLHLDYRRCIETQIKSMAAVIRGQSESYQAVILR